MINLWSENIKVTNLSLDIHKKWNEKGHVEGYFNHIIEKYCICKRLEKKQRNQESVGDNMDESTWLITISNLRMNEWFSSSFALLK